jgi:hypothetical protein
MKIWISKSSVERSNQIGGKQKSLVEVLRNSPLIGIDFDISRQEDLPSEIDFSYSNYKEFSAIENFNPKTAR